MTTRLKAALLAVVLALVVCCANSGSRGTQPNVWAGALGIYWWPGATALEQQWLTETANLHARLLETHLGASPRVDVVFYKTVAALDAEATRIAVSSRPNTYNLTRVRSVLVNNGTGVAFLHAGRVHLYAGSKLEGPELAHAVLHFFYGTTVHHIPPNVNGTAQNFRGSHAAAIWPNLLVDDWLLSLTIAARR